MTVMRANVPVGPLSVGNNGQRMNGLCEIAAGSEKFSLRWGSSQRRLNKPSPRQ